MTKTHDSIFSQIKDYHSYLNLRETEEAIKCIKREFQDMLGHALNLSRG